MLAYSRMCCDRSGMAVDRWLAFAGVLLVTLCTPGPDFAVVLRHALAGTRAGTRAAAGVITGLTAHTATAALGLAAVVSTHPALLTAISTAGAGYLGWLGLHALYTARQPPRAHTEPAPRSATPYRDGITTNLLNPKALLFFLGLLPQFLTDTADLTTQTLLLAGTTVAAATLWWTAVIAVTSPLRDLFARPRPRRVLDATTGAAFIGLAVAFLQ